MREGWGNVDIKFYLNQTLTLGTITELLMNKGFTRMNKVSNMRIRGGVEIVYWFLQHLGNFVDWKSATRGGRITVPNIPGDDARSLQDNDVL